MCKITNLIEIQTFNSLYLNYALLKKRGLVIDCDQLENLYYFSTACIVSHLRLIRGKIDKGLINTFSRDKSCLSAGHDGEGRLKEKEIIK